MDKSGQARDAQADWSHSFGTELSFPVPQCPVPDESDNFFFYSKFLFQLAVIHWKEWPPLEVFQGR